MRPEGLTIAGERLRRLLGGVMLGLLGLYGTSITGRSLKTEGEAETVAL